MFLRLLKTGKIRTELSSGVWGNGERVPPKFWERKIYYDITRYSWDVRSMIRPIGSSDQPSQPRFPSARLDSLITILSYLICLFYFFQTVSPIIIASMKCYSLVSSPPERWHCSAVKFCSAYVTELFRKSKCKLLVLTNQSRRRYVIE